MPAKPDPKQYDLSLLAAPDARQATLERMRGKLAAPSQAVVAREMRKQRASRMGAFAWGWRVALTLGFLAANVYILGFREEVRAVVKPRTAPMLPSPIASLPIDDQALYWTYALYDFDRLRARYGAPAHAVIDAAAARRGLEALLPKVSERARFEIRKYLPTAGGRA